MAWKAKENILQFRQGQVVESIQDNWKPYFEEVEVKKPIVFEKPKPIEVKIEKPKVAEKPIFKKKK